MSIMFETITGRDYLTERGYVILLKMHLQPLTWLDLKDGDARTRFFDKQQVHLTGNL